MHAIQRNRHEDLYDVDDAKERALSRAERQSLYAYKQIQNLCKVINLIVNLVEYNS